MRKRVDVEMKYNGDYSTVNDCTLCTIQLLIIEHYHG